MGINRLPITSARDASKAVSDSCLVICFAKILHSVAGEELSRGALFYLLSLAVGRA
jgi:hypothetical protein